MSLCRHDLWLAFVCRFIPTVFYRYRSISVYLTIFLNEGCFFNFALLKSPRRTSKSKKSKGMLLYLPSLFSEAILEKIAASKLSSWLIPPKKVEAVL